MLYACRLKWHCEPHPITDNHTSDIPWFLKELFPFLVQWLHMMYNSLYCYFSCQPMKVAITESVLIREVFCGHDGTMLLTDEGVIYACGCNAENKLALNHRHGFIAAMRNMFTRVWQFVTTRHLSGIVVSLYKMCARGTGFKPWLSHTKGTKNSACTRVTWKSTLNSIQTRKNYLALRF